MYSIRFCVGFGLLILLSGCGYFDKAPLCADEESMAVLSKLLAQQLEGRLKEAGVTNPLRKEEIKESISIKIDPGTIVPVSYDKAIRKRECSAQAALTVPPIYASLRMGLVGRLAYGVSSIDEVPVSIRSEIKIRDVLTTFASFLKQQGIAEEVLLSDTQKTIKPSFSSEIRYEVVRSEKEKDRFVVTLKSAGDLFEVFASAAALDQFKFEYPDLVGGRADGYFYKEADNFGPGLYQAKSEAYILSTTYPSDMDPRIGVRAAALDGRSIPVGTKLYVYSGGHHGYQEPGTAKNLEFFVIDESSLNCNTLAARRLFLDDLGSQSIDMYFVEARNFNRIGDIPVGTECAGETAIALPVTFAEYTSPPDVISKQPFRSRVDEMLGEKAEEYIKAMSVSSSVEKRGEYWFGKGCYPHLCGQIGAAFVIEAKTGKLFLMKTEDGENFNCWGFKCRENMPLPLQEWMRDF